MREIHLVPVFYVSFTAAERFSAVTKAFPTQPSQPFQRSSPKFGFMSPHKGLLPADTPDDGGFATDPLEPKGCADLNAFYFINHKHD